MMLIHSLILVILSSTSSSIFIHGHKSDGSTSQPLPALHQLNNSSATIPIIEAKSVKSIKNVSNTDSQKSGKTSSQPLPPSSQINSKRFGDLRLSSLLWSKKNVDPKFGFPSNIPLDHQLAGSNIQVSSLPGRTLSWNDQSAAAFSSSPLNLGRLKGMLPSLRLKDVLGKGNHQSMLQLTPSESSQVVVSSIDAGTGISSSLSSSSPATGSVGGGGGVSNSELGLSAVSSQLSNGLLMNQPQGTSSGGSSSPLPSSLTPDQVSKLTASFEHGFNQQVQQQLFQLNQQQQAATPSEVGGTSSIFRKLVSSGRRRIPSFPSLLRPSASSSPTPVNPLISSPSSHGGSAAVLNPTTKDNHISLHKLIPFIWPYKLSPPNSGLPIPPPPTSTTSKLRGLFKPKFFKTLEQSQIADQQAQDQQQIPAYLAHPDLTKTHSSQHNLHLHHHSDGGSLFVAKQPEATNGNSNSPSDQISTNIQFKPHLHL